jgi:XTP/dITP diphosphohydrolase
MLGDLPLSLISAHQIPDLPSPDETGTTFQANAQIKADAAFAHSKIPSLADDSGLIVPIIGGQPGVHSARYSEPHATKPSADRDLANRRKLLKELEHIPPQQRDAYFACVLALRLDRHNIFFFSGECHGIIIDRELGEYGFGYDPIFMIPSHNQTLAQISPHDKNHISHRALAIQALRKWLLSHFINNSKKLKD